MTGDEALELVRAVLREVAPEPSPSEEGVPGALGLDSVGFLDFAEALRERTGLEIPEEDYPRLATLEGCVSYLRAAR